MSEEREDEELEALLRETISPPKPPASEMDALDALLWEATESTRAEKELKAKKDAIKRIASKEERERALAEYRRLSEARIWRAVQNVALFDTQHCSSCGRDHAFFRGWYTEHQHKTDPHARKLSAGKAVERLPERIELSFRGIVELCIDCAGVHIAVDKFLATQGPLEPQGKDEPLAQAA